MFRSAWLLPLVALLVVAAGGSARAEFVDVELVLAVDVSGSIDSEEANLQRRGYAAAITNPLVVSAIQGGATGRIALTYFEWADDGYQETIVGWQRIDSQASAQVFAAGLASAPALNARRTSIGDALLFAASRFDNNGFEGARLVIDISGDGPNNSGGPVNAARDRVVARGVTINGLPVINNRPNEFGLPTIEDLDLYYAECVVGGPGAFYVVANSFDDFADAILRKMLLEIAGATPPPPLLVQASGRPDIDCLIGERRHRERFGR